MAFDSRDASLIQTEVRDCLTSASDDGQYLQFVQARFDDTGVLVADVYDETGKVVATYELDIVVGPRRR